MLSLQCVEQLKRNNLRKSNTWVTSSAASAEQNAQFTAIVRISENHIIVNSPVGDDRFGSLAGAEMQAVGPYLWNALTINNPAWQSGALGSGWWSMLKNALGWTDGKGPTGCIVFNNGDYGCFMMNIMNPNAARYLTGTGKNINNQPIDISGGLPNGGGIETVVQPNIEPPSTTAWGISGSQAWLFCATQGGELLYCWIEYVIY